MLSFLTGKKTLIVNVLALTATVFSGQFGFDASWMHGARALELLAVVNVVLRFMTKGPQTVI